MKSVNGKFCPGESRTAPVISQEREHLYMKNGKTTRLLAAAAALLLFASSCESGAASSAPAGETASAASAADGAAGSAAASGEESAAEAGGESAQDAPGLEDCALRLISCHPFEDDGEEYTFLSFALHAPEDAGFHLEDGTSETSEAWLTSNRGDNGWRIVVCTELAAGVTTDGLSLSVTDYGTPEETTVLLSDWGEPMTEEELREAGAAFVEGAAVLVGTGSLAHSSDSVSLTVGIAYIGGEYGNPDKNFPALDNAAELFAFYAGDGTPLAESMGADAEVYMNPGSLKCRLTFADGADTEAEIERLCALSPYLEYTGADGETQRFPLELEA